MTASESPGRIVFRIIAVAAVRAAVHPVRLAGRLGTGDPEIPESIPEQGLVTVGRCVPNEKRAERHVKGCPPNNMDIVQAIIGDRAKAERHWE